MKGNVALAILWFVFRDGETLKMFQNLPETDIFSEFEAVQIW